MKYPGLKYEQIRYPGDEGGFTRDIAPVEVVSAPPPGDPRKAFVGSLQDLPQWLKDNRLEIDTVWLDPASHSKLMAAFEAACSSGYQIGVKYHYEPQLPSGTLVVWARPIADMKAIQELADRIGAMIGGDKP